MSYSGISSTTPPEAEAGGRLVARTVQWRAVTAACLLAGLVTVVMPWQGWRLPVLFALGLALGATLYRTSFGFTSAYRDFLLRHDTGGVRAQVLMLALATALFAPALAAGSAFGYPVTGAFAPLGAQVVAGAFLFGVGMQLAGGCGSGTLYSAGGGSARMLVVLGFFCFGSFWASLHMSWWERLPSRGEAVLGDLLGWTEALLLQLAVLGAVWVWLGRIESKRTDRLSRSPGATARNSTLLVGAVLLAALALLVLLVAGHPWSITWAFTLWGAKAALLLGWRPDESAFWNGDFQRRALESEVLGDVTSVMDIGIVLGAFAAAGIAGRFDVRRMPSPGPLAAAVIGGLIMGYGARIAYGCNIGAFFSGVASTSLHGWAWIIAALGGNVIGIRLRPRFDLMN
ncbi:MAG: YeeE/YedE family protein [Betaproteobacteria bacterium]|nr:YeeE/YedE family protein [Betaproteobacteria bacterium]